MGKQTGGEDTAPPPRESESSFPLVHAQEHASVDGMLMQELADSKARIEKLEGLNSSLVQRASRLEQEVQLRSRERDDAANTISRLKLETQMAQMEAERATKELERQAASCAEMQLEIDLVTKASVTANQRAAQGEQLMHTVEADRQTVQDLQSKVQALQEWALASSEAKVLAQERVRFLENQLKSLQQHSNADSTKSIVSGERLLFSKHGSMVVGAGDTDARVFSLTPEQVKTVRMSDRVLLRWKFDLTSDSSQISFSILRGPCETASARRSADKVIANRVVKRGAAGETENAFSVQRACTIQWDNSASWIRPQTVKYEISAVVVPEE